MSTGAAGFVPATSKSDHSSPPDTQEAPTRAAANTHAMVPDLRGRIAFVAGVADADGFGWAIAKMFNLAGATVLLGCWAPMTNRFEKMLSSGTLDKDRLFPEGQVSPSGRTMLEIAKVYAIDVAYDSDADITDQLRQNRRFASLLSEGRKFTIGAIAEEIKNEFGRVDILVHSIANGPEVTRPLLETTRNGYLAAVSNSAYSLVSMVQKFAPMMPVGGSVISLTYLASERVVPGYGGGMSSAKAALESDTRTLAFEAGRKHKIRVNTISAGPLKSRAASAIQQATSGRKSFIELAIDYNKANAPLQRDFTADDVAGAAVFLVSPQANAVTGVTLYVDNGMHTVAMASDSKSLLPND